MTYLDKLKEHLSEKHPPREPPKPPKPGLSGFGGSGRGHISPNEAAGLCRRALASLDPAKPLQGLPAGRWRQLIGDAQWLMDAFAIAALHDGWTVGELFGLWPDKPGWGGIADRLQGSRSLKMTAERAHWRTSQGGTPEQFNRTAYPDLKPLWGE